MDADDTSARLALVEPVSCSWHRTPEEKESNATHDELIVDPELIIREEDWMNHEKR